MRMMHAAADRTGLSFLQLFAKTPDVVVYCLRARFPAFSAALRFFRILPRFFSTFQRSSQRLSAVLQVQKPRSATQAGLRPVASFSVFPARSFSSLTFFNWRLFLSILLLNLSWIRLTFALRLSRYVLAVCFSFSSSCLILQAPFQHRARAFSASFSRSASSVISCFAFSICSSVAASFSAFSAAFFFFCCLLASFKRIQLLIFRQLILNHPAITRPSRSMFSRSGFCLLFCASCCFSFSFSSSSLFVSIPTRRAFSESLWPFHKPFEPHPAPFPSR